MSLLDQVRATLTTLGLNVIGATSVAGYEAFVPPHYHVAALLPQAKTILVIGNGGGGFWQGFRAYCAQHPSYRQERTHPLDDYTVEIVEATLTPLLQTTGASYRYVYPFRFWTEPVSFMHLARAAGLAGPSLLGVTIHPVYGPWMALRAAVLLELELALPPQAAGFDPCPTCVERPCISACPANAISEKKGWDIPECVHHRMQHQDDCVEYCHARYHCVYGREHHYPLDELQYHQRQSFAEMRKYFQSQPARGETKDD